MKKVLRGIHYKTSEAIELEINDGVIERISNIETTEEHLPYIGPGLIDIQINGYKGYDFNSENLSVEDVIEVSKLLYLDGITGFYPAIVTNHPDFINERIKTIVTAIEQDKNTARSILGIHVEGPFISTEDGPRGAHPKEFVTAPNVEYVKRWLATSKSYLKLITLSPEWDHTEELIGFCTKNGIKVSIGHTAAHTKDIHSAVYAGASLSTHLGNGAHGILKRHPNYIWDQLAEDSLYASVIADGFHLPREVLKVFIKVKGDKTILISDSTTFTGLKSGEYHSIIGGDVVLSDENRLYMKETPELLAGSACNLVNCISFLMKSGLSDVGHAWKMASETPAEYIGREDLEFKVGSKCGIVLFEVIENQIHISKVIRE